jgi:hypothetical protein
MAALRKRESSRYVVSKTIDAGEGVRNGTLSPLKREWHGRRFDVETGKEVAHTMLGSADAESELRSLLAEVATAESVGALRADPTVSSLPWPEDAALTRGASSLRSARPTSSWSVASARGDGDESAPPTPGQGGVPDALEMERQRRSSVLALDAQIGQSFRRRALEEKMDEAEIKRLPIFMRVAAQREQRTLARWQKRNAEWEQFQNKMAKKLNCPISELVFARSEDHRSKEEEFDLVQSAIPADQKYGEHYWLMSLRNMGTRYVQVGNIFSGLFCPIREKDASKLEQVRRPERDTALATLRAQMSHRESSGLTLNRGNESTHSTSKALTERRSQLAKKLKQLRPHTVELVSGDSLMIVGVSLLEWARESTNDFFASVLSRASGAATLVVPTLEDVKSNGALQPRTPGAGSSAPFAADAAAGSKGLAPLAPLGPSAGPAVEVVLRASTDGAVLGAAASGASGASPAAAPLSVLLTTHTGTAAASVDVYVRNVGSAAVKCNWLRTERAEGGGASGALSAASPLDGGAMGGGAVAAAPFSLTRSARSEGGATARGWVAPGAVARWRISFASTASGVHRAAWELDCTPSPAARGAERPISIEVRGAAMAPDEGLAARGSVAKGVAQLVDAADDAEMAVDAAALERIDALLSAPRDRAVERALFEGSTSNVRARMHYSAYVFDEFERFAAEALHMHAVRDAAISARKGWHAVGSVQWLWALANRLEDEELRTILQAQLRALIDDAQHRRPEAAASFPFMRECVVELVDSIPALAEGAAADATASTSPGAGSSSSSSASPGAASPVLGAETPGSVASAAPEEGEMSAAAAEEEDGEAAAMADAAPRAAPRATLTGDALCAQVASRFADGLETFAERYESAAVARRAAALRAEGMLLSPKASLEALVGTIGDERDADGNDGEGYGDGDGDGDAAEGDGGDAEGGGGHEADAGGDGAVEASAEARSVASRSPAPTALSRVASPGAQTMSGLVVVLRCKHIDPGEGPDEDAVVAELAEDVDLIAVGALAAKVLAAGAAQLVVVSEAPPHPAEEEVGAEGGAAEHSISFALLARALDAILVDAVEDWEESAAAVAFLPLDAFGSAAASAAGGAASFGLPSAADGARVVVVENLYAVVDDGAAAAQQQLVLDRLSEAGDIFVNDVLGGCEAGGSALATLRCRSACVAGPALSAELAALAPIVEGSRAARPQLIVVGGDATRARLELALALVELADGGLVLCGGVGVAAVRWLHPTVARGAPPPAAHTADHAHTAEAPLSDAAAEELVLHIAMKCERRGVRLHLPADWVVGESPPQPRCFPEDVEHLPVYAGGVATAAAAPQPSRWAAQIAAAAAAAEEEEPAAAGEGGADDGAGEGLSNDGEDAQAESADEGDESDDVGSDEMDEDSLDGGDGADALDGDGAAEGADAEHSAALLAPVPEAWHILDEGPATVRRVSWYFVNEVAASRRHPHPTPSSRSLSLTPAASFLPFLLSSLPFLSPTLPASSARVQYARNVDLVSTSRGVLWVGVPGCIELTGTFREPIEGLLASLEEATAAGAHVVVGASRGVLRLSLQLSHSLTCSPPFYPCLRRTPAPPTPPPLAQRVSTPQSGSPTSRGRPAPRISAWRARLRWRRYSPGAQCQALSHCPTPESTCSSSS